MPNTHSSAASTLDLPSDLVQLASAIESLPTEHAQALAPLLERVIESTGRRRRILALVQDALGQLRLDMKYLMFDLEATRRERDEAHSRLEEQSGGSDDGHDFQE
ncbi:transcriptional regulator [Botrimarina sp.]|uniref:transcriptional regulator n=1 Tax=Botrimarina sp. TaxID=2795802 RepID=UPI0032ED5384